MSVLRISLVVLFLAAAIVMVAPQSAMAQGLTVGTVATFDQPIEIPGHLLPAGRYAFIQSGSSIVQVWDQVQGKLVATLLTNAAEQRIFAEHHEFEFDEATSNHPLSLKAWFFDASSIGHEFIYEK